MRSLRNATDWSQVDLATACQLSHWDAGRDIIAKIEAGKRQVTDHELIVLAKVLMVSVAELIGETPLPLKTKELVTLLHSRRYSKTAPKVARLLPR